MKNLFFSIFLILFCSMFIAAQEKTATNQANIQEAKTAEVKTPSTAADLKYEAQLNITVESLTNGYGTWRTASLYLQRKFKNKQLIWGNYRLSDRNSIRDNEFVLGTYVPLRNKWAFTTEGTVSNTHKFVGKYSVMAEVEKGFKKGLVIHGGSRFTAYDKVKAVTGFGIVEKYWGDNRAAYTLSVTKLTNAGTAPSHRFQYNRYYGENVNSFGFGVSFGKELENLGPVLGVLRSNTLSFSVSERHWITKNFGVNIDGVIHRQGNLYYRRGLNIGIRYRF